MNVRRGMWRSWIVGSAVWAVVVAALAWPTFSALQLPIELISNEQLMAAAQLPPGFKIDPPNDWVSVVRSPGVIERIAFYADELSGFIAAAILPPGIVLALGQAVGWAARGFKGGTP